MSNYEQFLKQSLKKYKNPEIAKRDVIGVFASFNDLRPKLDDFVFNDGASKSLLQLDGTIPVIYKGTTYNIPICIWLMDTHPYNPPMVFVRPTPTMQIKQGRNVDMNGKIDLPYLREWKYPSSDLMGMIQILTIVFGEEPPVYSRSQPPQQQQHPAPSMYPGQQTPYPAQAGTSTYPMPMPSAANTQSHTPYPPPSNSYGAPNAGSYPAQFQGYNQAPAGGYQGYPTSYSSSTPTASTYPSNNTPYPAPASSMTSASSYPSTQSTSTDYTRSQTITEEHLKASLLSAVEDKIKWRLKETFAQAQAEMDVLYKTQADLLKGKDKLEQMMNDLEKEKIEIDGNIQLLKQKDGEVKETLTRLESQDQITIDDAVTTTAPLYRQLLKAFAEEQAIEDAIYYLGEALRKNVLEIEVFLKQVRELSRKQFMLRALIQKCREKAGLPQLA